MGGTFGLGTSFTSPMQQVPWGIPPYGLRGSASIHSRCRVSRSRTCSRAHRLGTWYGHGEQPLQQVLQLLQLVPQQLQQLEQLQFQQIQQLQQVHQLVQLIPPSSGSSSK